MNVSIKEFINYEETIKEYSFENLLKALQLNGFSPGLNDYGQELREGKTLLLKMEIYRRTDRTDNEFLVFAEKLKDLSFDNLLNELQRHKPNGSYSYNEVARKKTMLINMEIYKKK